MITIEEALRRIKDAKEKLKDKVVILGHYYQRDEVLQFADYIGDSLKLSKYAKDSKTPYIIFCGVHFMAETADILTADDQIVILPNLKAGCTMSDMASYSQVESAFEEIINITGIKPIPIVYINSNASIKAFCGKNDGIICTSSNAKLIIDYALKHSEKILFLPDQHLGRNTAYSMGVPLEKMILWDPFQRYGGNSLEAIKNSQIILWKGFCRIHQLFKPRHVDALKEKYTGINILVHPECSYEVFKKADYVGSTDFIVKTIENASSGSKWAIGTENNLVIRLKNKYSDKFIIPLSPFFSICPTMSRITIFDLLYSLEGILVGNLFNQISVPKNVADYAKISLERMLSIH